MTQHNPDLNERLKSGDLPADASANVVPITNAARQSDEDTKRVQTVRQLLSGAMERAGSKVALERCTTGHYWIDQSTGGIQPKFVWVLGADTNWGKSSALISIADENIKLGKRVLIVSSEDAPELYGDRLMCRRARVNANRLRERRLTSEEWDRVAGVGNSAEDCPVYLSSIGKPIEWAAKRVRAMIRSDGIDLVAWDYLQAFDNEKPQDQRREQLNYITRTMIDVTKEAGVAGIIASQITIGENKKHPDKHSIRDSRDVSNMAEVVALGFTADKPIVSGRGNELVAAGSRCLFIDKVKSGVAKRVFAMQWDSESACFDRVERSYSDAVAAEYDDLFDGFDLPEDESDNWHP